MNYTEIKEIDYGGFAKVILVTDEEGKEYAKKVFLPHPSLIKNIREEHLTKRFIREVKYQSSINHRNIVKITDAFL